VRGLPSSRRPVVRNEPMQEECHSSLPGSARESGRVRANSPLGKPVPLPLLCTESRGGAGCVQDVPNTGFSGETGFPRRRSNRQTSSHPSLILQRNRLRRRSSKTSVRLGLPLASRTVGERVSAGDAGSSPREVLSSESSGRKEPARRERKR
jgi:hypothetical protein